MNNDKMQLRLKYCKILRRWEVSTSGNGYQWVVVYDGNKKNARFIYYAFLQTIN